MRVGVYGGSFDPPHVGHVLLAAYALSVGGFDRVLVVPVFAHAFHKVLTPFSHRVRMCELAFGELSRVEISSVEAELPTPSRTLTTLERLARDFAGAELALLVGADVLAESSKWHAFDEIVRLAPLFVVGRAGHAQPVGSEVSLPAVSSTRARELCHARRDATARAELTKIVPRTVLHYIEEHQLYGAA
jgi:nicotinate-nucleotide adenylyltransferase